MRFRFSLIAAATMIVAGCTRAPVAPALTPIPYGELRLATDSKALLDSARNLMVTDSSVGLITVDSDGQPRVRTVKAFIDPVDPARPDRGVTVWVMTRLSTRKVGQIRDHAQVTLYFNDDAKTTYASIMGIATIHRDPQNPGAKRHYDEGYAKFFWPDFPGDFVMIEIRPRWIEFIGPGIGNDPNTWRPQAVVFDPVTGQPSLNSRH